MRCNTFALESSSIIVNSSNFVFSTNPFFQTLTMHQTPGPNHAPAIQFKNTVVKKDIWCRYCIFTPHCFSMQNMFLMILDDFDLLIPMLSDERVYMLIFLRFWVKKCSFWTKGEKTRFYQVSKLMEIFLCWFRNAVFGQRGKNTLLPSFKAYRDFSPLIPQ